MINLEKYIPLGISIITAIYTAYNDNKVKKLDQKISDINNQVSIIPCLNVSLKDSYVIKEREDNTKMICLNVYFTNIGKASLKNLRFEKYENGSYIKSKSNDGLPYIKRDYLNKNYLFVDEKINYAFEREVPPRKDYKDMADSVSIKVIYEDLIGNVYRQEIGLGFYYNNEYNDFVFKQENYSGNPELIKKYSESK